MTIQQWDAHPEFRQELAELLKNPTLSIALELIRDTELAPLVAPNGAGDLVQYFALMGAQRTGVLIAVNLLRGLAKPLTPKIEEKKPWTSTPEPKK